MPEAPDRDAAGTRPVRRIPAVERVLDHILTELDAGRLTPGSRVNAARLAARLDLSAAPVREALSILAGRGVVQLLPDRGAVMRELTPAEVIQLWEVVASIGALGLSLAARAIAAGADPTPVVDRYAAIVDARAETTPLRFLLRLNDYHWAAHEVAGNRFLTQAIECLGVAYWDHYLVKLIDVGAHLATYRDNYRRMHEAVMAGDAAAASAILHHHAAWSVGRIRTATQDGEPGRRGARAPLRGRGTRRVRS